MAVKALARELPAALGAPLSRLHVPDLRTEAIGRRLVADISGATVWQWLSADAIRPWAHRSWIFPRDPDFAARAGRVLDLYARTFQGRPQGDGDYAVSAHEKPPSRRAAAASPPGPRPPPRRMRVEDEYDRGGVWC